jgi:PAS domain S-box-containing protein
MTPLLKDLSMPASTVDLKSGDIPVERSAPSILIVEDEVIVAEDVRRRLEEMGYRITGVVSRGDQALSHVRRIHPDLILMDIGLKGAVDGIEAAKSILMEEDIPIVFASAYSDDATLRRAKTIDPFGFVLKPFDERELRTAIEIGLYKHETESRLRERENHYRSLVELSTDGIATLDLHGTILFCNAQKAMMHGVTSPDELTGRFALDLVAPEDRERAGELLRTVLDGRSLTDEVLTLSRTDGSPVIVEISAMLIKGLPNRDMRVMCVEHDVTHRRQTEADLRLVVQQLQFVVENLNDGILFEDATGRIRLVNSAFCRMFGTRPECTRSGGSGAALAGETSALMADAPGYIRRIDEIRAAAVAVHGDILVRKAGGPLQRDYAPLQVDGAVLGHVWQYHTLP